jgi:molybdopterin guanine dinucleotide-containing S/N-oxide reductase-like protein
MVEKKNPKDPIQPDKTVIRALALAGLDRGGAPCAVDVKDGKIIRVRPLHYDWKYDFKDVNPWKFEKNGKTLAMGSKSLPAPFSLAYKKRTYSPNRIKYPLKRVDWNPDGERNPQNRGKSKYMRISWDEATDIIAKEIKRIHKEYGPYGILCQGDGHGECKTIHAAHGQQTLLLEKMGGFTQQVRNPDSWEGWYWGSKHVWGHGQMGMMEPSDNIIKDMTENCGMILFWGCDPETTMWGFTGQFASRLCYFWSEIGIKQVYICPDLNYGAAIHADKWIPILPNTDAALQLAVAYVWITKGTYDKEYVKTHTVGFDKFSDYVLGKEDGVPKTPAWASPKCGVPEWTIKALAKQFAANKTSIAHHYGGSMIRGPYSTEPARLECILLGMQGLGKPGIHQSQMSQKGMPRSEGLKERIILNPAFSKRLQRPIQATVMLAPVKQFLPKTLVAKGINDPPVSYFGAGAIYLKTEDQFKKYTYPIPKQEGGTEVHMLWTDTPCLTTCWNDGNSTIEAFRNKKIEFIVAQHPWLENDCLFADVILPANTTMEVDDIVTNVRGAEPHCIAIQEKAIEPIGESKSDFEVVGEVARKLGLYEEFTEGKTVEDMQKSVYDGSGLTPYISWKEFKEKSYFCFPYVEGWEKDPVGMIRFVEDPEKHPLDTPSGKLEFYSERLAKNFPDDKERPPVPHWIEKGESHDERISSNRAKMYPLLQMSNHGRWRVHAQCDDISWTREAPTCKVKGYDGYMYEPLWIHPIDAEKRGIKNGDIVKVFNERGTVLGGAIVWERIMPGVVYMDHGARVDYIIPGKVDRGGAIDLISPAAITSKNCVGMATSGFLVEAARVTMEEMEGWRKTYPEAFEREYDPASGLRFNGWVEGGM